MHIMREAPDAPRSTYYASPNQTIPTRKKGRTERTDKMSERHQTSTKRYGAPKIHFLLRQAGYTVGINRVQRLMKKAGVRSIVVKKFRPTPSKEKVIERDNLLERDFSTKTINEKWVG